MCIRDRPFGHGHRGPGSVAVVVPQQSLARPPAHRGGSCHGPAWCPHGPEGRAGLTGTAVTGQKPLNQEPSDTARAVPGELMFRHREPAVLVLEDGRAFVGSTYGAIGQTVGEAVFSTGMSGYQETLTDPSYHRQVVVMTAPHIGNTGVNDEDNESSRIWVAGYVVRDPAIRPSSWRSRRSLEDELIEADVVGISGIDTRALTRHLRERGAMRVGIFSGPLARESRDSLLEPVSYTHLRAHETVLDLVCRLLLAKKK